jgi:hypothetical protein
MPPGNNPLWLPKDTNQISATILSVVHRSVRCFHEFGRSAAVIRARAAAVTRA